MCRIKILRGERNKLAGMKLNLGWSTIYKQLLAKRSFWLVVWFLVLPVVLYCLWLSRGYSLDSLQIALMLVTLLGLIVVNLETAAVVYKQVFGCSAHLRGFVQRILGRSRSLPIAEATVPVHQLPFVSVIVAAYLPNEQDIILETLEHWLTQVAAPAQGWEIILAYNTPVRLPIEDDLRRLSRRFPELVLLPVHQSTSKAENLNAALKQVRGEMTCIFDADHRPGWDCLMRAWVWLEQGNYDGVQGRNIIRNCHDSWLTAMIAVEFECIYGVSHYGRSLLVDTALFGGSNGYWRTSAIRAIGFHAHWLTEDIDATLRALLKGYRIVHDPNITTTELAPVTLKSLWLQRQRWSQGWMEVAGRHLRSVVRSPHLDLIQKTCWIVILLYSLYFHTIVWQIIPISLSLTLMSPGRDLALEICNLILMGLLTLSMVAQVVVAMRPNLSHKMLSWSHGLLFCFLSPLYFWFKSVIALVSFYNHLSGQRTWHVTQRSRSKTKPTVVGSRL